MKVELILGRVFIFLLFLLGSLLLAEKLSVFFFTSPSPIEELFPREIYRNPKPYTMFGGEAGKGVLNNLGYRGPAPLKEKKMDEFRIIMLGGSTTVLGEPPISQLLKRLLEINGFDYVTIYNFGVISSVSGMELSRVVFEAVDYKPVLILVYNGANDVIQPWFWDPRPGYPFNFIVYENNFLLESDLDRYPAWKVLAYGSNILRTLVPEFFSDSFIPLERVRNEVGWGTSDWAEEIAQIYVANIAKMERIAQAYNARLVTFFQPMVYYKNNLSTEEMKLNMPDVQKHANLVREQIFSIVKANGTSPKLKIVDLSSIYNTNTDWVFYDAMHTRQSAKDIVAEAIYDWIRNQNIL